MMRKINSILAMLSLALFILHGILGALNLTDIAPIVVKGLAHITLASVFTHAVLSIILTIKPIYISIKTKAPYFKQNRIFWARRISGVLILVMIVFHLTAFNSENGGALRLVPFDAVRLTSQLLFLLIIAVHIISNVKPALISFGIKKLKTKSGDILFFVTIALLFMAAGFIIYYLRWQL